MFSWLEVLGQWKHGIVYPRWAALAHWGYGEARFLFYPPASWTLGAALGAILPWKLVPGAYCWIVLTMAGASMYWLARQWLAPSDALFAAVFYALNPYHLLIVYWRSAYAELLAAVLLPLLLLSLLKLKEPGIRPTLWLSLVLASAWLTNAPAAVMIHYSAAGLALVLAARAFVQQRSWTSEVWRLLRGAALAIFLGAGLAAFYLLPAIYEQRWVDISQVLSPGVRPQENFLFTNTADADHNHFNLFVSAVALAEICAVMLAIGFARKWKESVGTAAPGGPGAHNATAASSRRSTWMLLSVWGVASATLMLSLSNVLWQHLPKLRFVQLPFRWLLCLNAAFALLLTMAAKRWTSRLVISALLLATLVAAGYRIQQPWWDTAADIKELSDAVTDRIGYEGTDEYVPAGVDAYELNQGLPLISDHNGAPVANKILAWTAAERHLAVHAAAPQNVTVRLLNYPAWEVVVNGAPTQARSTEVTGLIIIPVAAGDNDIQIHFRRTADRLIGNLISLLSLCILLASWFMATVKPPLRRSP